MINKCFIIDFEINDDGIIKKTTQTEGMAKPASCLREIELGTI